MMLSLGAAGEVEVAAEAEPAFTEAECVPEVSTAVATAAVP
jgi:hypothetical protein